jgi:hypothetical protein
MMNLHVNDYAKLCQIDTKIEFLPELKQGEEPTLVRRRTKCESIS